MLQFKRIMSLALVMVLVAGMLPPQAFAAEMETVFVEETVPVMEETTAVETTAAFAETEETAPEEIVEVTTVPAEEAPEETIPGTEAWEETVVQETAAGEIVCVETTHTAVDLSDSEELFEGFLDQLFFGSDSISTYGILARNRLSEANKFFYDQLKYYIELIARGKRTSTVIDVNMDGTGYDFYDIDFGGVLDALTHDCPYEMYWYGGAGGSFSYGTYIYQVVIYPRANYRPANYNENNPTINTFEAGKAADAADNARSIVEQYESYTDYNKLVAYADKICSLVKYDNSAANNNTADININPWTLVNVFDNDTSTNVVCEGYSEAFQYLCDLSDFDGDVKCYSVTGANHKWNIVRIEGISYLMDVTNCDNGKNATKGAKFLGGGKGDIESGYVIGGFHYWYYPDTLALWGTGPNSILKLSEKKYDPSKAPAPSKTITQAEFEEALRSCGGKYRLTKELTLTSDLVLEGVELTIGAGGVLVVASGAKLTLWEDASIVLEAGGKLYVDVNGFLLQLGTITNNGGSMIDDGTVCDTASEYVTYLVENCGNLTVQQIRQTLQGLDMEELRAAMAEDTYGYGIMEDIAKLEEKAGGPVAVKAEENSAGFDADDISVVGANLNVPSYPGAAMTLVIGEAQRRYENAIASFSLKLKNAAQETELTFPVKITLELPGKLSEDNLSILHGNADGTTEPVETEWKYGDTAVFVVTELGDFVLSFPEEGSYGDNITWKYEPETKTLMISGTGEMPSYNNWGPLTDCVRFVVIEQGVTKIGYGNFEGFVNLEEVTLSEGLTEIGRNAFSECKNLRRINIPESVQTIGDGAFQGCAALPDVRIPETMTVLGDFLFYECTSLTTITIPRNVTVIGDYTFLGCTSLKHVTFEGDAPTFELAYVGNYNRNFENVVATVYYPAKNPTWTEAVRQNYGGSLTWEAACINDHDVVVIPGNPPNCVDAGLSDGEYCAVCGEILAEQRILLPTGIHTYTDESDTICDVCGEERVIEEDFPFTEFEWEVLKLTNEKRVAAGVEPLTGFSKLQQAGDIRAEELIEYFSHSRPDGTSCFTVLAELGLDYRYAGENIASGYQTPSAVVSGWMNSQGHRENILNPNFSHMGVGEKKKNWVQLFISGGNYASIRLLEGDRLTVDPGTDLDELDLVGVLMNRWGRCYLPVSADYCQGYDPNALGDQQVTLSVLGVSTTFTVHIHDWAEATCTTPKSCQTCGETKGEALGHKYKAVKTEPTCTESGYTTNTCKVCGDVQIEENAPALGHKEAIDKAVAPTCTNAGLTEGKHCSVCGEVLTAQLVVDALGHAVITDAGYAPTCIRSGLTEGQHCERCGEVLTAQETLPATGHDFAAGFCRSCGAEDKADYDLYSGKNMTLKAYHPDTGGVLSAKQVTWSIGEAYEPFAAMNPNGKLTAKKVFERVRVEAVATLVSTGEAMTYLVDIFPAVTQAEVACRDEVVNGKTILMDFAEESLTLKAEAYPLDTQANVTWTVSDKKAQYAEYTIDGDTLTISAPKSKAGTVTIKATIDAGVKKNVTVKVSFGSYAKTVEIAQPEKTVIKGGETLTLTASITEPGYVTKPGIVWTVSDKNAATVSNGKVKAKNVAHPTTVTVTATSKDGQASDSIEIKILPKNEGQLVLMDGDLFVTNATRATNVGDVFFLEAYTIQSGEPVGEEVIWTTSKASIAQVDKNGRVTAVGNGTAKITATAADGRKAVLNVKVSTLVDDMEITTKDGKNLIQENEETMVLISSGKSATLVANILTAGANKAVTWEIIEGSQYAKLASSGKITANKDLTSVQYVTVKATAKDGSGTNATIRVKILPLATGVQIYERGTHVRSNTTYVHDMLVSETIKLSAKVYPAKANQDVELTSSNKKVAEFIDGELVCHKPGTVTITAKALDGSNAKTTFKLTIVKRVNSLTLKEGSNLTVVGGKTLKLAPMVQISPGDATNKKLTWSVALNDYGIKISASGVLSTKKVARPVTVNVMAITQDGSGQMLSFDVTVYPV